ncbi:hypothetical protein HEP87_57790 [Streptomyces sp. S1D4-11]|nr:hypothetical protein [Streptomyces sp. S1D4-11]
MSVASWVLEVDHEVVPRLVIVTFIEPVVLAVGSVYVWLGIE